MTLIAAPTACLFNSVEYANGLSHLGTPRTHEGSGITVLSRPTLNGDHVDGKRRECLTLAAGCPIKHDLTRVEQLGHVIGHNL